MLKLTAHKALIFRITDIANVPWILKNGVHCCNSECQDSGFCAIGNPDLIDKRSRWQVPIEPGGVLGDYVPFYFTPHSIMLYNIKTGYGVKMRPMADIAILATSLHRVVDAGSRFVFTDRHAYLMGARFSSDLAELGRVDWSILNSRDFRIDPNDPGKKPRYMAEALVHHSLPVGALEKIVCHGEEQKRQLEAESHRCGNKTPIVVQPDWYF